MIHEYSARALPVGLSDGLNRLSIWPTILLVKFVKAPLGGTPGGDRHNTPAGMLFLLEILRADCLDSVADGHYQIAENSTKFSGYLICPGPDKTKLFA